MISATAKITRIAYCVLRIAYGVLLLVLKVKFNITLNRAISIDLAAGVHHGLILLVARSVSPLTTGLL